MSKLVAQDHLNVAKRIANSYNVPGKLDYNKVLQDLNQKLEKSEINEELYGKAVDQLDMVLEKSKEYKSFKRVGEQGKFTYELEQK